MKRALVWLALTACSDGALSTRVSPLATACGPGTHEVNGECVVDRYEVRIERAIGADGVTKNKLVVFGWQADGSPALDDIVLTLDRADGGRLTRTALELGQLGATSYFVPCDQDDVTCVTGPLEIRVALASDPGTIVGKQRVTLVDPLLVNPARPCLGGGSRLKIEGNDVMLNGSVDITNGTWSFPQGVYTNSIVMTVTPTGAGDAWSLEVNASRIPGDLVIGKMYEEVSRARLDYRDQAADLPAMYVRRTGADCASIRGRFQILDYTIDYSGGNPRPQRVTLYFEQHCNGDTSTMLRGCVHYQ